VKVIEVRERRIEVGVCLTPEGPPTSVDGLAVELRDRFHEAISPRVLLPISGVLAGALSIKAELRADQDLPRGALVVASCWGEHGDLETATPTETATALELHMRGCNPVAPADHMYGPERLLCEEREALARAFPWVANFHIRCKGETDGPIVVEEPHEIQVDDFLDSMGLDGEDAELLRSLLEEEDLEAP
jgi:hypothetical protein